MSKSFYSTALVSALILCAGEARAAVQPSLDEVLSQTLRPTHVSTTTQTGEGRTCRTLTDMGRRGRRETVCMTESGWRALIVAALVHAPQPLRPRAYGR